MKYLILLLGLCCSLVLAEENRHNDEAIQSLIMAERFEFQHDDGNSSFAWEGQGWVGKDLEKLWLKTEGEGYTEKEDGDAEVQFLYSRAIRPFWDVQLGLKYNVQEVKNLGHLAFGVQGLAPYWFELDIAGFVSEEGKLSSRLEAEYELYFTQKLILQPRVELNYAFSSDKTIGVGKGITETNIGFRLRYEYTRRFAPYIGFQWSKTYRETSDWLQLANENDEVFSAVIGLRFWY